MGGRKQRDWQAASIFLIGLSFVLIFAAYPLGQEGKNPWVWGPNLGAIGEDFVMISWNTSRAVGADLSYAVAVAYASTGEWEETLAFNPHQGVAEVRLGGLKPGTAYRYQVILYEGDAVYSGPIGRFTTSSTDTTCFSFLVYGDTRSFPVRHRLVAETMREREQQAAFVINAGDLVESPTMGRFENFFWAIADLALSHPYLAVLGNHERGHPRYYEFLPLPTGGGEANEEWWSFDYGDVHFVGLDSNALVNRMRQQIEWLKADLARSDAQFKVVFFHHPIFSSTWKEGVNISLGDLWEPIFREYGVDVVFNGHMHCYEHFYVGGIHHVVTGGGGAPLQAPVDKVATGTVFRRYRMLHYMRVTVDGSKMTVEMVPVASVYEDEEHIVPTGRALDSFTISKAMSK